MEWRVKVSESGDSQVCSWACSLCPCLQQTRMPSSLEHLRFSNDVSSGHMDRPSPGTGKLKCLPVSPPWRKPPPMKIQYTSSSRWARLLCFPGPSHWRACSLIYLVTDFPFFPLPLLHHKECLLTKILDVKCLLHDQDLQEPKERQLALWKLRVFEEKLAHLGMPICKYIQFLGG